MTHINRMFNGTIRFTRMV